MGECVKADGQYLEFKTKSLENNVNVLPKEKRKKHMRTPGIV